MAGLVDTFRSRVNPGGGAAQLTEALAEERAADTGTPGGDSVDAFISNRATRDAAVDAEREAQLQHQAALEAEHGQLSTLGTQFARGALDAVLAPGALLGLAAEGWGGIVGSEGLEKFGRDLGRSSTGSAALEALAFGGSSAVSGVQRGIDTSLRVKRDIEEQEQAWPTLAAVSRAGGAITTGLAAGGLVSGAKASAGALIGAGAFEGAGAGAQAAYERNAALRDVVTSALLGGALGGGLAAGGVGLNKLLNSPSLKRAAKELSETSAFKAAVTTKSQADRAVGRLTGEAAEEFKQQLGRDLLGYKLRTGPEAGEALLRAGQNASDLAPRVERAVNEITDDLQQAKDKLDVVFREKPELSPDLGEFLQRVDNEVIAPLKGSYSGGQQAKVAAVERELAPLRQRFADRAAAESAEPTRVRLPDGTIEYRPRNVPEPVTFRELDNARRDIAKQVYGEAIPGRGPPAPPAEADALLKVERILADHVQGSAERALAQLGDDAGALGYRELNQKVSRFIKLRQLTENSAGRVEGNNFIGLTDTITGAGAVLSAVTGGAGAVGAIAQGAAASFANKAIRERARSTIAVLANNLVLDAVAPAVAKVLPTLERGVIRASSRVANAGGGSGVRELAPALSREEQQDSYKKQLAQVQKAVNSPDPEERMRLIEGIAQLPAPLVIAAGADMQAKLQQLATDMPKPKPDIRGEAFETLSSQQVRLGRAMFEATTAPLSIFDDFANGSIDYDKVQYAWQQWPGLKQAAQAGLMDMIAVQLKEDTRAAIPDATLTQMDYLYGFNGTLQQTVDRAFAQRMTDAAMQEQQQRPAPNNAGPLNLPTSKPTFTQRLSGVQ